MANGKAISAPATTPTKVRRFTTEPPRRRMEVRQYYGPKSDFADSATVDERNVL